MLIPGWNAALQGIQMNQTRFATAAERIARATGPQAAADDLPASIVDLESARQGMEASLTAFRAADEVLGTLIDTLA